MARGSALSCFPGCLAVWTRALAQIPGGSLDPASVRQVHDAAAHPAGHAAGREHRSRAAARTSTTTRSRCGSSRSRSCRRVSRHHGVGLRRGQVARAKSGLLIHNAPSLTIEAEWNRPVRVKWINELVDANGQLPAAPAAGRPDAALGQPARRRRRGGTRGRRSRTDAWAVHRPGADGHARARRRRRRRRERRLRRGLVPARGEQHPGRLRHRGHLVRLLRGQGRRAATASTLGAGLRDLPVPERRSRLDDLVPRPHAGHDPAQRLCRTGRLLHHPRRPGGDDAVLDSRDRHAAAVLPGPGAARRTTSSRRTRPTTRSRSPSRTARSTPTARCSIRTRASSSTASTGRYIPRRRRSRRSGTRSSSATRSWSTATPGRSRPSSSGATGSASSTAASRAS